MVVWTWKRRLARWTTGPPCRHWNPSSSRARRSRETVCLHSSIISRRAPGPRRSQNRRLLLDRHKVTRTCRRRGGASLVKPLPRATKLIYELRRRSRGARRLAACLVVAFRISSKRPMLVLRRVKVSSRNLLMRCSLQRLKRRRALDYLIRETRTSHRSYWRPAQNDAVAKPPRLSLARRADSLAATSTASRRRGIPRTPPTRPRQVRVQNLR